MAQGISLLTVLFAMGLVGRARAELVLAKKGLASRQIGSACYGNFTLVIEWEGLDCCRRFRRHHPKIASGCLPRTFHAGSDSPGTAVRGELGFSTIIVLTG